MTSASIDLALLYVALFFVILLIIRLTVTRLFQVYPAFFAFLCVCALLQAAAIAFGVSNRAYFFTYIGLQPVRILLSALVVWELFRVIFKNYVGLRSLSEWAMGVSASVGLFGFLLSFAGSGAAFKSSRFVQWLLRVERGVDAGLVIFVLIMLYFVSRYPIKLPRNSVAHTILYSIWFLGDAGILLASTFWPRAIAEKMINTGQTIFETGCYVGWMLLLSKKGEHDETQVRKPISPETEKALIIELDSLNQMLERAGRSIFRN